MKKLKGQKEELHEEAFLERSLPWIVAAVVGVVLGFVFPPPAALEISLPGFPVWVGSFIITPLCGVIMAGLALLALDNILGVLQGQDDAWFGVVLFLFLLAIFTYGFWFA